MKQLFARFDADDSGDIRYSHVKNRAERSNTEARPSSNESLGTCDVAYILPPLSLLIPNLFSMFVVVFYGASLLSITELAAGLRSLGLILLPDQVKRETNIRHATPVVT